MTKIVIHGLYKLTDSQQTKIKNAMKNGEAILNNPDYRAKLMALHFSQTKGFSNSEICDKIMSGADGPNNTKDNILDVSLTGFHEKSSTIGWTTVNGTMQYINTYFLDQFTEGEVFGHILHEYCHRLGFIHRWTDHKSVPYQVGYASRDFYKEFYKIKEVSGVDFIMDSTGTKYYLEGISSLVKTIMTVYVKGLLRQWISEVKDRFFRHPFQTIKELFKKKV